MPVTVIWEEGGLASSLALDTYDEENYNWDTVVSTHPVEGGGLVTDQVQLSNPKLVVSGYITNKPMPSNYIFYGAIVEGYETNLSAAGEFRSIELEDIPPRPEYSIKRKKLVIPSSKMQYNAAAVLGAAFKAITNSGPPEVDQRILTGKTPRKIRVQSWQLFDTGRNRIADAISVLTQLRDSRMRVDVISDIVRMTGCVVSGVAVPRKTEDGEGGSFTITFEQIRTATATETARPATTLLQKPKQAGSKATTFSEKYPAEQAEKKMQSLALTGFKGITS